MLRKVKIECENWYWNRKLQLRLFELGVAWPMGTDRCQTVWNSRRRGKYLFLQQNHQNGSFWLGWGSEHDFQDCPFEAVTAKGFLNELTEKQ